MSEPNPNREVVDALRATLKERDRLRRENARLLAGNDEPIAIVGMSCRYPGGIDSPEALLRLVMEEGDAIGEFPTDRGWDLENLFHPDPDNPGTSYGRKGGFIDDAPGFDAEFFAIGRREAIAMDPQQRVLLEVCWEAVEDCGIDPASLRGSQAGVFAGISSLDYQLAKIASNELEGYRATGNSASIISGRVAYTLGLEGPAITIDTACSSSLVAMHLACQALRQGECTLALAGGVTVLGTPAVFIELSRQRALAVDGRSKAFAQAADGAGFSEGVGVVALERLSEAERNGHRVLAVIRGSAVNQDGASNGLSAPNGPAQERVIRQALANARLAPQDVDAVEAHGTGTPLGDPIEATALLATYGQERERPLKLGSIKSNIGHTQGAAGVAGVIKMVMALRSGMLPKTLHVDAPSSNIDWEAGRAELLTEAEPWEPNGRPRRAAVSSFGISGTNAHLIVEEAPAAELAAERGAQGPDAAPALSGGPVPLLLSAKTEEALSAGAEHLAAHLRANPELDPVDVAYSLATTRSAFERRAVVLGTGAEELLGGLGALGRGEDSPALVLGRVASAAKVAFLFSGHGSQWNQMALGLIDSSPAFAAHIAECEQALSPLVDWSLQEELRDPEGAWLDRLEVVQPILLAVMISLAKLWRELGAEPSAVVGHSLGEIAAAHVAGGLSLEDAARLGVVRARLITKLMGKGSLASIALPAEQLEARLERWGGAIEIAAVNGPSSSTVTGSGEAMEELLAECEAEQIRINRLPTSMASHSAQVEVLREELLDELASISPQSGEIPLYSTVTGEPIDIAEMDASYWYRNLRQTVLLEPVARSLVKDGYGALIEMGPHPVLAVGLRETAEAAAEDPDSVAVLASLRRDQGGPERFALSLAQAHAAGVEIDWEAFFAGRGARRVPLPTYPFQRKRFWIDAVQGSGGDPTAIGQAPAEHPLLSAAIDSADGEGVTFTGRLSLLAQPWLAEHVVFENLMLPSSAFIELALRAGAEFGCELLEELIMQAPLVLPERGAVQLQVILSGPDERRRREVSIHSRPAVTGDETAGEWTCNAKGTLSAETATSPEPPQAWPPPEAEPAELDFLYERLAEVGFEYGPTFQGLRAAWREGQTVYAEVSLGADHALEAERFGLHPALLDAAFHAGFDLAIDGATEGANPVQPIAWRDVRIASPGASSLRVRLRIGAEGGELAAFDESGAVVASIGAVVVREVDPSQMRAVARRQRPLYRLERIEIQPSPGSAGALTSIVALGEIETGDLKVVRHPDLEALLKAIEAGAETPELVLAKAEPAAEADLPAAAHAATEGALALVQAWVGAAALGSARLAVITEGAVAVSAEEAPELSLSPVWGLLRSAQSEYPDRLALIDTDGTAASREALAGALAISEEPQLALREGVLSAPRLARAEAGDEEAEIAAAIDPDSTVLITGGVSGLGALVARHLAAEHGARHLLLASRSGESREGAVQLREELEELGAEVTIAACDVSDRGELEALLAAVPDRHPLGIVIHSAGVSEDGMLDSLDDEGLRRVMRPKVDAAWHLHELTRELDLSQFVLFSSVAGLLGAAAQAPYAAANAFLDALAARRQAEGLPAVAMAWGLWSQASSVALEKFSAAEMERLGQQVRRRLGVAPMPVEQGLKMFDAALAEEASLLAPVLFDNAALRGQASSAMLPAVLRGLVRVPVRRERGSLAKRLAGVPASERTAVVLDLVRSNAAAVLGHASAEAVPADRAFKDLGFDSLAAVELGNRLKAATGLPLAATIVFDYPNAAALADYLLTEATAAGPGRRLAVRAQASDEPIAIVGMSCRYPGGIDSPEALLRLVMDGGDAIGEFPTDRGWDLRGFFHPDPDHPGTSYANEGGFLHDAGYFDAEFFGISPREALATDPQQRLLLEASWEALEDIGIDPSSLRGSSTGVFAGATSHGYAMAANGNEAAEGYNIAGTTTSVISGRVAYTLGLEGPAITIDTACSSSLVAMHLASQALRGGECDLALAGGVTVLASPLSIVPFSRQRGLAPNGRSKAFAEAADGVGVSEGVGILALERLSDAERNGHQVLATIKGSAVNQDGASNGITAPNGPSQERVIRQALANAGLAMDDVDAVEAHGTGTALGDPIEAGALLATYGQDRERPLKLGSIKSNIGHAQGAAGVAGVIKMVMALRSGMLPKTLHVDAPSTKVDWDAGKVELLTEAEPWGPNGRPRRAGISSFGISGTNAHLIVEEAPEDDGKRKSDGSGVEPEGDAAAAPQTSLLLPLVLSAKSEEALAAQGRRLAAHLEQSPELDPVDVAYSLATGRTSFERRAVVLGTDREELLGGLAALAAGETPPGVIAAEARQGRLAYLFTGQGAQRPGMGRELHEACPAYAEAFDAACELFDRELPEPLAEIVFGTHPDAAELLDHTSYAQPALFATEVALFRLLGSLGLTPGLLAGHSIGEIAAAHVAGVLSLADATKLVAARGRLMGELPVGGAMVAVEAAEEELAESIAGRESELAIAAINGPRSSVVSGAEEAVAEIEATWKERGRKTKRLAVSHAFHSPLMDPMLTEFEQVARELVYAAPQIPIVSNLSGELLGAEQATDPAYWVAHVRGAVRFADAVAGLAAQGATTYVELGPDGVLSAMAAECLADRAPQPALIPTLREGRPEWEALGAAFATAHASGARIDWEAFFAGRGARRVPLPTYPFQRKHFWLPLSVAGDPATVGQTAAEHPLLGAAVGLAGAGQTVLTGRVSLQSHPWLADHSIAGMVLLPGTAFVELALRAGEEVGCELLEELTLQAPLVLSEQGAVQLQVAVAGADEEGRRELSIHARAEAAGEDEEAGEWVCHAQGLLSAGAPPAPEQIAVWPPEGAEPIEVGDVYERFADLGVDYGPSFQGLTAAWQGSDAIYAEISVPKEQVRAAESFGIHPGLLDSAFHAGLFGSLALSEGEEEELKLPFAWRDVSLRAGGSTELRVRLAPQEEGLTLSLSNSSGAAVAEVGALVLRSFDTKQLQAAGRREDGLLVVDWESVQLPAAAAADGEPEPQTWRFEPESAGAAGAAVEEALAVLQAHLATPEPAVLAILTEGAMAAREGDSAAPAAAAVWGLVRSAQSEHPGRFLLVDSDGSPAALKALPAALRVTEESQLVLREGVALAPRITRATASPAVEAGEPRQPIDPERTVLITGGTSGIGALVARHLVEAHGARHLLLVSRSGESAEGAAELASELAEAGAEVRIAACDVGDRAQLQELLSSIPEEHSLGAVIHAAGTVADGLIEAMTPEQVERVLGPKANAAWHLHELTAELELSAFVLFSAGAGTIGAPGQANYAAANVFLDALAARRRTEGLEAISIVWGQWERGTGITAHLSEADLKRVRRLGAEALSDEQGLALFDLALEANWPLALAMQVNPMGLRTLASVGALPPILRRLVRIPSRRQPTSTGSLVAELAGLEASEREAHVLGLVRAEAAAVLGHASGEEVDAEKAFMELGFDSLAAVEMRNRLGLVTGLQLPATLIFDYPSPVALAGYLLEQVDQGGRATLDLELSQLETTLATIPAEDPRRPNLSAHLRALAADLESGGQGEGRAPEVDRLEDATDDELLDFIDEQVGSIEAD